MKELLKYLICVLVCSAACFAGSSYKMVVEMDFQRESTTEPKRVEPPFRDSFEVRMITSDGKAKGVFERGSRMFPSGTYFIRPANASYEFVVVPESRTYAQWPGTQKISKPATLKRSTFELEKQEPGENVSGYPTTHYVFRGSFDFEIPSKDQAETKAATVTYEVWTTDRLPDVAISDRAESFPMTSFSQEIEQAVKAQFSTLKGRRIKTSTVLKIADSRGTFTSKNTTTLSEFQTVTPASDAFDLPHDFREVEFSSMVAENMKKSAPMGAMAGILAVTPPPKPGQSGQLPMRIRVSAGIAEGMLCRNKPCGPPAMPVYPELARRAGIQGFVRMRVIITQTGDVAQVQLISGHPLLAPAAIDAVKQWKYHPYLLNGQPVEVETEVTVPFTLP